MAVISSMLQRYRFVRLSPGSKKPMKGEHGWQTINVTYDDANAWLISGGNVGIVLDGLIDIETEAFVPASVLDIFAGLPMTFTYESGGGSIHRLYNNTAGMEHTKLMKWEGKHIGELRAGTLCQSVIPSSRVRSHRGDYLIRCNIPVADLQRSDLDRIIEATGKVEIEGNSEVVHSRARKLTHGDISRILNRIPAYRVGPGEDRSKYDALIAKAIAERSSDDDDVRYALENFGSTKIRERGKYYIELTVQWARRVAN